MKLKPKSSFRWAFGHENAGTGGDWKALAVRKALQWEGAGCYVPPVWGGCGQCPQGTFPAADPAGGSCCPTNPLWGVSALNADAGLQCQADTDPENVPSSVHGLPSILSQIHPAFYIKCGLLI